MPQRLSLIRVFLFSFLLKQEEIIIHMEHEYKFAELILMLEEAVIHGPCPV